MLAANKFRSRPLTDKMTKLIKVHAKWLIPLLLMLLITPFSAYIDLNLSRRFYDQDTQQFSQTQWSTFIYTYGLLPGKFAIFSSFAGVLLSYVFPSFKGCRRDALFVFLTILVGAGVITQAFFKDHWGRPRPRQVIEFGGKQKFRPYYSPNFFKQPEPSKSFPSGHCAMGFLFFSVVIVAYRRNKKCMLFLTLTLTLLLSGALGYARIAQGGHFFSDVIMSGLIMWFTAIILETLIFEKQQ